MKKLAEIVLAKLGYEIRKKSIVGFNPSFLSQICSPNTVIDVGVGYGTYPLYEAFPKARFVLVEPLRDYEAAITEIQKQYDCEVYYNAVADVPGKQEFTVDTQDLQKSSFADRTSLTKTGNQLEKRSIEVTTLDSIYSQTPSMKEPILIKIDTEGHELKALQGARSLLNATDIVIAEVSIAKRFEESYEFEDLILFMKENGFYLLTILTLSHPRGELRPRFADIVFKRR